MFQKNLRSFRCLLWTFRTSLLTLTFHAHYLLYAYVCLLCCARLHTRAWTAKSYRISQLHDNRRNDGVSKSVFFGNAKWNADCNGMETAICNANIAERLKRCNDAICKRRVLRYGGEKFTLTAPFFLPINFETHRHRKIVERIDVLIVDTFRKLIRIIIIHTDGKKMLDIFVRDYDSRLKIPKMILPFHPTFTSLLTPRYMQLHQLLRNCAFKQDGTQYRRASIP